MTKELGHVLLENNAVLLDGNIVFSITGLIPFEFGPQL